jgi:hypothetical protein
MQFGGTIDYFRDTVFNYPTMAECYKVAAFDGQNKISLDLQLNEEICQQDEAIIKQVDELVAEVSSATQAVAEEEVAANSDAN